MIMDFYRNKTSVHWNCCIICHLDSNLLWLSMSLKVLMLWDKLVEVLDSVLGLDFLIWYKNMRLIPHLKETIQWWLSKVQDTSWNSLRRLKLKAMLERLETQVRFLLTLSISKILLMLSVKLRNGKISWI
jgi:hypothetical protein